MLFSGKIENSGVFSRTRQQVISGLVHRFEKAGIQVEKTQEGVKARVPGVDTAWFPVELPLEHLDDHLHIDVCADGHIAYRWIYWTRLQLALHGIVAAIFLMDAWMRQTLGTEMVSAFLAAQAVPPVIFFVSTQLRGRALFASG